MKEIYTEMNRIHLDENAVIAKKSLPPLPPHEGWLRSIRLALGMPLSYLAGKLSISVSGVRKMEQKEIDGKISIATLKRAAEALDCDLRYMLIPRKPIGKRLQELAEKVAEKEISEVMANMGLEGQLPSKKCIALQKKYRVQELITSDVATLWRRENE